MIVVALLIGLTGDENAGLLIRLVNDQHYWCIRHYCRTTSHNCIL